MFIIQPWRTNFAVFAFSADVDDHLLLTMCSAELTVAYKQVDNSVISVCVLLIIQH